jgi:phage baseplate assembly protein W
MHVDFPWRFDAGGRTARTTYEEHVRDMLELLIFTDPGERVNRPDYGCGLRQLIFAPNSPELAAALQFTMQAAIQRELGDIVALEDLRVEASGAVLQVFVQYLVLRTGSRRDALFEQRSTA